MGSRRLAFKQIRRAQQRSSFSLRKELIKKQIGMCHPANYNKQLEVRRARRVVRKYRRLSYRKEMARLRSMLDCPAESVQEAEVLERTVSLIEDLEARLLQRLSQGAVPERLGGAMSRV